MSGRVISCAGKGRRPMSRGVGMLEFMIALLIFSTGMAGLLSFQLAGKRAAHEAARRTVAIQLGRDILERIQANPGEITAYRVTGAGDLGHRLPTPAADCNSSSCTAPELASFDLWQWESALLGEAEQSLAGSTGGLVSPRACITSDGGRVTVAISWLGATTAKQAGDPLCGEDGTGDDEGGTPRRQLSLSTFVATR